MANPKTPTGNEQIGHASTQIDPPSAPTATTRDIDDSPLEDSVDEETSMATLLAALAATPDVQPPTRLEPKTIVDDSFEIEREIGAGGMGVVYVARDLRLGRRVALKLHAKLRADQGFDRLMREATAMARLSHPNVLTVHEVGSVDGQVFIAMEYVDGWNLRRWLEERKPDWSEIHQVFLRAGEGLAAAHEAGLVHRDFKPDNILIGRDGRVMVADFGLARAAATISSPDRSSEASRSEADSSDSKLTVTGALMGTPAYMAPEQSDALDVDARADQFAYCVSLYEALYGQRPFRGDTVAEMLDEIRQGNVREPPSDRDVPRWIQGVIYRGLEVDAELRFPDMRALLDQLRQDPRAGRRRLLLSGVAMLGVAGVAATIGIMVVGARGADPDKAACSSGADELAEVWNDNRRRAIRSAFMKTELPIADNVWLGVRTLIDGYAGSWIQHHRAACEDTRVHKTQSENLLDLRVACLDSRLNSLDALLEVLVTAGPSTVERAISAATHLPPVPLCSDRTYLLAGNQAPADPRLATKVRALRQRILRADALSSAGRQTEALAEAKKLVAEARSLDYPPIEAEALLQLGIALGEGKRSAAAVKTLDRAFFAARRSKSDEVAGLAAAKLANVLTTLTRWDEAERWSKHAVAEAERAGDRGSMPIEVYNQVAGVAGTRGRYDEALRLHRKAYRLQVALGGPNHPRGAKILSLIGAHLDAQGKAGEAAETLERALAILEANFGRDHSVLTPTLGNLGLTYYSLGKHDRAVKLQQRALDISQTHRGIDSVETAYAWLNLGVALYGRGTRTGAKDVDRAIAAYQKALAIIEKRLGADHPDAALCLTSLGVVFEHRGKYEKALEHHRRALKIHTQKLGPKHFQVAIARFNIGVVLLKSHKFGEAEAMLEQSVRIFDEATPGSTRTANPLQALSSVQLELGKIAQARSAIERAEKLTRKPSDQVLRGKVLLTLADVLWRAGERERAVSTMKSARVSLASGNDPKLRRYVDAWLARPGPSKNLNRPL